MLRQHIWVARLPCVITPQVVPRDTMPRMKRKRSTIRVRRVKRRGTSLRRRKAKKLGRKWKSSGVPRTIVSSDFQRRSQAVNFEYTQQWSVSPKILSVANSLQFIQFKMNDPTNIFGDMLPFAFNNSPLVGALPNYAAAQRPYGDDGTNVSKQSVGNFTTWSNRYEKACVIGSKVTLILRPKLVFNEQRQPSYESQANTAGTQTTTSYPVVTTTERALDASRIITLLTDAAAFGTDPESVNTNSKIPGLIRRSGVKQYRMSYTPGGKDGAFATVAYSPKKFNHIKDLKDCKQFWSDIGADGRLTMMNGNQPVKPVYGIVAIQKEELNSPSGVEQFAAKPQHDYYIECKYSCTVLFKDPYEVEGTNIPTATTSSRGRGDQMTL